MRPGINEGKPWKHIPPVAVDFAGPFAVVPHRNSRYLITPAGALVKIRGTGKPLARATVVYDQ